MGGKASVVMIMGFIYIFSIYMLNMSRRAVEATENVVNNYGITMAHQIAVSGMNIASSKLYQDINWRTGMNNIPFQGGTFSITFGAATDTFQVNSISSFLGKSDTVIAYFSGSSLYSKYTLFTANENGVAWSDGDTVWGPLHTNDVLNHQNKSSIVFNGKVTAGKNISPPPKNSQTKFLGGYEVGIYLPAVSSINTIINAASSNGYTFPAPSDTMKLQFLSNGNVIVYQNSTPIYPSPGVALTTLAPNGAIYSAGNIAILGGTINTNATGITIGSGNNIIFFDQVQYASNPLTNPLSDDIAAFVAWNNIIINNQTKNDWTMQCILMAANGSITAVEMTKNGSFNYYGSVYQKTRGNAKMFQSFNKKYRYDNRLLIKKPPFYPGLTDLHLVAWWE